MASTFNPYPGIGAELSAGLNDIAAATPSTVDDLVDAIYDYIQPIYYPTSSSVPRALEIELKASVYNVINMYNNNPQTATLMYGPKQSYFIDLMLGLKTTTTTPINALGLWLNDIEDNITKDNLGIAAQTPLLLAVQAGKTVYPYWKTQVGTVTSPWASYFETDAYKNYVNIPMWTAACMEGALVGAQATAQGMIAPTTEIVSTNIVCSLIGALAIGSGKVIFKWIPRLQPSSLAASTEPHGCGCEK